MESYFIQIWHAATIQLPGKQPLPFPGPDFTHVADVEVLAPNLKLACAGAFRVTQHGLQERCPDWTQSNFVKFCHHPEARSTSAGDIFVLWGTAYRVLDAGFAPLR